MTNKKLLEKKLQLSLRLLENYNKEFDGGFVEMAMPMSVELRKLFYNCKNSSISLLKQLNLENTILFLATQEGPLNRFTKLVKITNESVVPCLDSEGFKKIGFKDWWSEEPVSITWADDEKSSYTREDIICIGYT